MAIVEAEHKKDGWHWVAPDGKKGGPFDTKEEAFNDGYAYQLKVEADAEKPSKAAAAKEKA